jgi:leader peptidase (prepilin peptidase)/N-methyltransferase
MAPVVVAACAAAGLLAGALANVAIVRWVGWRMVVAPLLGVQPPWSATRGAAMACAACGAPLGIGPLPAVSYVLRLGRCGQCRRPLSRQYLVVEVVTAVLFAIAGLRFETWAVLLPMLALIGYLVPISVVDVLVQRIPTRWVYEAFLVCAVLVVIGSIQHHVARAIEGALIGAVGYFGFLLIFHLVSPRRMGFGDVRLALLLGLMLGWLGYSSDYPVAGPIVLVIWGALAGSAIGAIVGISVLVATRRNRYFPFGPGMAAGALLVLYFFETLRPHLPT